MNAKANSRKWAWMQLNERRATRTAMLPPLLLLTLAMAETHLTAQVFKTLHTFTGGSDGANPLEGLISMAQPRTVAPVAWERFFG